MEVWHKAAVIAMSFHRERGTMGEDGAELPSWVPDLSRQRDKLERRIIPSRRPPWRTPDINLSLDKRVLKLRGISFDTVSQISSILFDNVSDLGCLTSNLDDFRHAVSQATAVLTANKPTPGPLYRLRVIANSGGQLITTRRCSEHSSGSMTSRYRASTFGSGGSYGTVCWNLPPCP